MPKLRRDLECSQTMSWQTLAVAVPGQCGKILCWGHHTWSLWMWQVDITDFRILPMEPLK